MSEKIPLWAPSKERKRNSNMARFIKLVNERFGKDFRDYDGLYQWSIENISDFWATMWDFAGIKASQKYERIIDDATKMPGARWFEGAELNFAENLLRYRDDRNALVFKGEGLETRRISYAELYDRVARLAKSLRESGVEKGDRVVGFMPNMPETVIAMLAATSLGAVWSSCSPDFGIKGVLDRFGQIKPKVLFTADGYFYNGKTFDSLGRVSDILSKLPETGKVVVVPYVSDRPDIAGVPNAVHWDDFLSEEDGLEIDFVQVPFMHPLYIMYSSGTTGLPKCMVQSQGGILIHHLKELMLHTDLKREDRIFYFTTCGWMMWNWLVSSLGVGATLILYDGSPFHPDAETLFRLADEEGISILGVSAKLISALENAGLKQLSRKFDLSPLKAVLSTGSPLPKEGFEYVYREIKKDLQLASISGGTDLNGCFALGNPIGPIYSEELQCRGLAMKVKAYDEDGKPVIGKTAELVCEAPFPSMPIYFWDDEGDEKYLDAYFRTYPGIWHHGDFIKITDTGGVIMYGRSDATLNPQGVRIGTADIYSVVETMPEIDDSVVVGQDWDNDVRVILFVKLAGDAELGDELRAKIKKAIRVSASPRHVPAKIIRVADIPYTINMKKVELAVRKVIHGHPVLNRDALANPEALDLYKDLPELDQ